MLPVTHELNVTVRVENWPTESPRGWGWSSDVGKQASLEPFAQDDDVVAMLSGGKQGSHKLSHRANFETFFFGNAIIIENSNK
jgi:hypothetical protein